MAHPPCIGLSMFRVCWSSAAHSRPAASVPGCKGSTGSCAEVVMNAATAELLGRAGTSLRALLSRLRPRQDVLLGGHERSRWSIPLALQLANAVRLLQCNT